MAVPTSEVVLNLWNADEYGDGTHEGIVLTAYQLHKDKSLNSSEYVSVNLRTLDVPKRYVVDDEWAYPGTKKHSKWMQLFICKLIEKQAKENN